MTHYTMYAKSNTTDVDKEVTKNWEEFLHNNTDFIHPFDFVKVSNHINRIIYPLLYLYLCEIFLNSTIFASYIQTGYGSGGSWG